MIRIPHGVRTGEESEELPIPVGDYSIGTVSNSKESATGKWLHATFNHASQDKIWRTLGVTAGFKQPAKPFEECFCTLCATANARGKGLKPTQYSIVMLGNSTCPSSVAFGQDIADQEVVARTQQAMVNSLEYKTLEDQARFSHEAAINATLAWDARDNAGNEPYQTDGYESSSTTSSDSLNQVWYTAKAEDEEDSDYEDASTDEPSHSDWVADVKGRASESKSP